MKKGSLFSRIREVLIIITSIASIFGFLLFVIIIEEGDAKRISDCLEPIGRETCESKGMIFSSSNEYVFRCKDDLREASSKPFLYLEEEINECKEKGK